MSSIYALFDSADPDEVPRYIGQTKNPLHFRKAWHVVQRTTRTKTGASVREWVGELIDLGRDIGIRLLEEVPDAEADAAEVRWIRHGRIVGWPLLNRTFGGRGGRGRIDSPEVRSKRVASRLATMAKKTDAERAEIAAKISATLTGQKLSEETRAKMSATRRGRTHSEETRAKIAAANHLRVQSPETREKIRQAKLGKKLGPRTPTALSQ